jgi:MSHA biogenesis protein MshJ
MKQQWQQLALRVDAMQLRERAFLFLTIVVCALALADAIWLSPAQLAYKQATLRIAAQVADLQRLRDELKSLAQPVDASKVVRDEIAEADLRLDAINREIREVVPLAEGGPAIEQALVQFLRRREGLTLLKMGTLQQETVGPASATPGAANPSVLSRRGLELSVSGSYSELVRYVQTLENALPTLRWGNLQLKTTKQKPELTLQVYVVGVPP